MHYVIENVKRLMKAYFLKINHYFLILRFYRVCRFSKIKTLHRKIGKTENVHPVFQQEYSLKIPEINALHKRIFNYTFFFQMGCI